MAIRTVRLDQEAERVLEEIREATGLPISEALKQGLRAFWERVQSRTEQTPFEIYRRLDLGDGGWAIESSDEVRRGVRQALKKKFKR